MLFNQLIIPRASFPASRKSPRRRWTLTRTKSKGFQRESKRIFRLQTARSQRWAEWDEAENGDDHVSNFEKSRNGGLVIGLKRFHESRIWSFYIPRRTFHV
jgi:hypothetical protein